MIQEYQTKKFFKITNREEKHHEFQYHTGLNVLKENFKQSGSCVSGGLYFSDLNHICGFLGYGVYLREVTLPFEDNDFQIVADSNDKWRANKIILGKRFDLDKIGTFKYLVELGASVASLEPAVLYAFVRGYFDIVVYFVKIGCSLKSCHNHVLEWACKHDYVDVIDCAINLGADPTVYFTKMVYLIDTQYVSHNWGKTPTLYRCIEMIKHAVKLGAHYQNNIDKKIILVHAAAMVGDMELMAFLVESGVDVTIKYNNAIKQAAKYGQHLMVKYLAQHGADINAIEHDWHTKNPLILAAENGHLETVKTLVMLGASVVAHGNNAIMLASLNGRTDVVKYLVENGANFKFCDNYCVRIASKFGHFDIVKYLAEMGADIRADNDSALIQTTVYGYVNIAKYLVERGADVHVGDNYLIREASANGFLEMVKYLVEKGANLRARNDYALIGAADNGHVDVVKYLVECKADLRAKNDSALVVATKNGHLAVVKYLVENGANAKVCSGFTLAWAFDQDHWDVVSFLQTNGAIY